MGRVMDFHMNNKSITLTISILIPPEKSTATMQWAQAGQFTSNAASSKLDRAEDAGEMLNVVNPWTIILFFLANNYLK